MLRHYISWDTEALRNWNLEGSNNGNNWEIISVHNNDKNITMKGQCFTWDVETRTFYSMFRIKQTGTNSNNHWYVALSGFEIYGSMTLSSQKSAVTVISENVGHDQIVFPGRPLPSVVDDALQRAPNGILHFTFSQTFDQNGILYWLGTNANTLPWSNPSRNRGEVRILSGDLVADSEDASAIAGRQAVRCVTKPNMKGAWFIIDFLHRKIKPTHYMLRHYISWDTEALRNWNLEGSNNGNNWEIISVHNNDKNITMKGQCFTWDVETRTFYSMFRIKQTGTNSNNHWYVALSGFEIYGSMTLSPQKSAVSVISANVSANVGHDKIVFPGRPLPDSVVDDNLVMATNGDGTLSFVFSENFDENGILYWLGTNAKTMRWSNPCGRGEVRILSSVLDSSSADPSTLAGRVAVRCVTTAMDYPWFIIDFLHRKIKPTHYMLRHYVSFDTEALRNWNFEGSNDGKDWELIKQHTHDHSLKTKGQCHTWYVGAPNFYSMFRIIQTGLNSNQHKFLALSGFEIYGWMMLPPPSS